MDQIKDKIERLKKEKRAVIMAHYYVRDEIQEIADYVGDSYFLSEQATKIDADIIVLCGVKFMGESAKILNPDKKVLLPARDADCPMAHMASVDRIAEIREQYEDVAVVCYVNSTAELKASSDVCVTSSNAEKIVAALPNKNIFFIPDQNLARHIAGKLKDKNIILNDGYCHVHHTLTADEIRAAKKSRPDALVLAHPECRTEVLELSDYIGSTAGIIDFATKSDKKEFIVVTELGVLYELKKRNPDKIFYSAGNVQICPNMKKITLESVLEVLDKENSEVELSESLIKAAYEPMKRMLELAK
ncbi:MAG: quinolinate synthase NadA [Wujia sp.]